MARNLDIALDYLNLMACFDTDGALDLVSDSAIFMDPDGSLVSKEDIRARFAGASSLFAGPFEQVVTGTTEQGSRVAIEAKGSALLRNGNTYENIYHFMFEVRDDKIVQAREYCNTKAIDAFSA